MFYLFEVFWSNPVCFGIAHSHLRIQITWTGSKKSAIKIILTKQYKDYENGVDKLNLQSLYQQRITFCANFAFNTTKHEKLHTMFPKMKI